MTRFALNETTTAEPPVSAYELFAEAASGVVVTGFLITMHPKVRDRMNRRRERRLDLDGRPPRYGQDEAGNRVVLDPGTPSLATSMHTLTQTILEIQQRTEQLTRNAGSTVADAVHRIEQSLTDKHAEQQRSIEQAKDLAGQAAVAASQANQRGQENRQEIRGLRADLDAFTNVYAEDNAEIWTQLHASGIDRRQADDQ